MSITPFTGVPGGAITGTAYSAPANIELAKVPASSPAPTWFPLDQPDIPRQRFAQRRVLDPEISPALYPAPPPQPTTPVYLFAPEQKRAPVPIRRDTPLLDMPLKALDRPEIGWLPGPVPRRPEIPKKIWPPGPELPAALLAPFVPPPKPVKGGVGQPLFPPLQAPYDFQRARKAISTLSEMMNNLMEAGYIKRISYSPVAWEISTGTGVFSFNGRTGAITLLTSDVTPLLPPAATTFYQSSLLASGSAVSLTTATPATVTSLSLAAGEWDVTGVIDYVLTGATATAFKSGSNTVAATFGSQDTFVNIPLATTTLSDTFGHVLPTTRFVLSLASTIYLVAQATFSAGTVAAYGTLRARKMA